jgi:GTPase SAR1 family protein
MESLETLEIEVKQKFGQLIIGAPGSGKTTYIKSMKDFYSQCGRKTLSINLDPANDNKTSVFDIDIRNLINLEEVEEKFKLGPNGSFLYCINFLNDNISWLDEQINQEKYKDCFYYLIDTPGQIEIFTVSPEFKNICDYITDIKKLNIKLCCVNLIECINMCDMPKYIFSIFSVLNAMINLALPQVNFISKCDLIKDLKATHEFELPLEFYKNPNDETQLKYYFEDLKMNKKFKNLNEKIAEFIASYGLVGFTLLDLSNPRHLNRASYLIDKANGYIYMKELIDNENLDSQTLLAKNDFENEDIIDEEYEV